MENRILNGLSDNEVIESRAQNGVNILTPPAKISLWKQYLAKCQDPLIIILLIAGALSIGISCYEYFGLAKGASVFFEPVGIFVAILLATGLAFIFELKANKEFNILNQVNDDEPVQVIRNSNPTSIPKRDVVVGDIVILSTGEEVPADGELLEAVSLSMDESTLTGEPLCTKTTDPSAFDQEATFPSNQVMRGTKVMEGHAVMRVFAVGDRTENGKVFQAAQIDDSVKTPLNEQLDGLGKLITNTSYCIAALVVIGRVFMYLMAGNGFVLFDFIAYFLQTIMIAVTLIVVAVPEGLPMAVTLSLAYSMRRMLQTNNLVRKLHACETMGATTVICTDKTGTLTQNRMTVVASAFLALKKQKLDKEAIGIDPDQSLIAWNISCNSTASLDLSDPNKPKVLGNPTEGALLLWLAKQGIDYVEVKRSCTIVAELPFSTMRKHMATEIRTRDGKGYLLVKGAPEIVLGMCRQVAGNVDRAVIEAQLHDYQKKAMRTLGFAAQEIREGEKPINDGAVVARELVFLGFVAISDPVREDVPAAIGECLAAGINVKIVTGDTPETAKEIGRQIGLWQEGDSRDNVIVGPDFAELSDSELDRKLPQIKIIARARPMDKEKLVRGLQRADHVVAVTGDGTNDAPALNAAHVGLSMGDGTSVAKEASDITIIDNSFASIGRAVMWGRSLYQNIQRFILFQMTVNVAACLTVLFGAFMGTDSPLTVTQMLWVNLIMDTFAAMALASIPPRPSVMQDKPRKREAFIINGQMKRQIIWIGGLFFVFLIGLVWLFEHSEITCIRDILALKIGPQNGLSAYELSLFFTIFVMLQFWNMFNARAFASCDSALCLKDCGGFLLIAAIIFLGQILIVNIGGEFFNVVPLKAEDWIIVVVASSLVLWIGEVAGLIKRRKCKAA